MNTKRLVILHSNDMHGDFLAEMAEGKEELVGGLALLSGYINKVRAEEEHVLYVIAGDMLQGSLIDSEYKGISTIEIMNYLAPDVVAIGNHELDYGLPHLLFLEKMANFPLVNANLYITTCNKRLLRPHLIVEKAGFDILFTGIITEKVMDALNQDTLIGSFVSLEEASVAVGRIANAYKDDDIDLTVLLTHIGFESDLELASMLRPEWGVDMIIGGHSHTILREPARVNDILVAQAGMGSDQIGRFDIVVDDDTNSIVDYTWRLIPINDRLVDPDPELAEYIHSLQAQVDHKYDSLICKLSTPLTHPDRTVETALGNLVADALVEHSGCDVMLVGSGAIRVPSLGPLVRLRDLMELCPYDDAVSRHEIRGASLRRLFAHVMRPENRNGEGECYQVNAGVRAVYDEVSRQLVSLSVDGRPVEDDRTYTLGLPEYHLRNSAQYLSVSNEELLAGAHRVICTSSRQVIEEYLRDHQNANRKVEGRLVYADGRA